MSMALYCWAEGCEPPPLTDDIEFKRWSISWAAVVMFTIMQIIMLKRDISGIQRVTSFGALFVICIILFMVSMGVYGFATTPFDVTWDPKQAEDIHEDPNSTRYLILLDVNIAPLAGIFAMGYYFH